MPFLLHRLVRSFLTTFAETAPGGSRRASRFAGALYEPLEERAMLSTYYVSATGNDTNSGTSINASWKSIGKVNSVKFKPGDTVLFDGGQTFSGSLYFGSGEAGSASAYVTIGSYGGIATISSGTSDGAHVYNTSGIQFQNLKFLGTPGGASQCGICFETTNGKTKLPNIGVSGCEITGYTESGILVEGDTSNSGFTNVVFTNSYVHDNVNVGIETFAATQKAIDNVQVLNNKVYSNYGDGKSYVTGSGIELGDVNTAMVKGNYSYDNGWKGGNGGVGIWAYESTLVTFLNNASVDNHGLRGHDGDGFDFDADTSDSIMEGNVAEGNDGTGFQLDQWRDDSLFYGDGIVGNVAINNGQKNGYASLEAWGRVMNSTIENNTVYFSRPTNGGTTEGVRVYNNTISGLYVIGVHFVANTFVSAGGMPFIQLTSAEQGGQYDLTFEGDSYDSSGSTPTFEIFSSTFHSLAAWANATGEEKTNGVLNATFSSNVVTFPTFVVPPGGIPAAA